MMILNLVKPCLIIINENIAYIFTKNNDDIEFGETVLNHSLMILMI